MQVVRMTLIHISNALGNHCSDPHLAFQPRTQVILQTMDLAHDLDKRGHRLAE